MCRRSNPVNQSVLTRLRWSLSREHSEHRGQHQVLHQQQQHRNAPHQQYYPRPSRQEALLAGGGFDIVRTDGVAELKAHCAPGRSIRQPSRR